jgi:hypothetical protein
MQLVAILGILVVIAGVFCIGLGLYLRKKHLKELFAPQSDQMGYPPVTSAAAKPATPELEYKAPQLPPMIKGK